MAQRHLEGLPDCAAHVLGRIFATYGLIRAGNYEKAAESMTGARSKWVLLQLVLENTLLGFIGGAIGVALSVCVLVATVMSLGGEFSPLFRRRWSSRCWHSP